MIAQVARINGFKRFVDTTITLDRRLLAFVGANEAGKSSFLESLLSIEHGEAYEKNELTKGFKPDSNHTVVEITYLLDKDEQALLKEFGGKGKVRQYVYSKAADGEFSHYLIGKIERDKTKRSSIANFVNELLSKRYIQKVLDNNKYVEDEDGEIKTFGDSLRQILQDVVDGLNDSEDNLSSETFNLIDQVLTIFDDEMYNVNTTSERQINLLKDQFTELVDFEEQEHPINRLLTHFYEHRPKFILFGPDDRNLKAFYSLEDLEIPSKAISNLVSLAGVRIEDYLDAITENEEGERLKLQKSANKLLQTEYMESWTQTDVYPQLLFDLDGIRISIISSGNNYTQVHSRSEGMKMFIALKSFLAVRERKIPPILLIDEAEIHLHYAAQSDLVTEFEKQSIVNSIIYTTHSAGCLPSDLGSGIRGVEAIMNEGIDSGRSILKNSIWGNSGGFSPILLAMGANVIAMTLARKAVMAEGPSETILLPRMLREAANLRFLDFQVAPGIASVSKEKAVEFEFEAAKTVYLVDGDCGGDEIKQKLLGGGISDYQIIQLEKDLSLEDYLDLDLLLEATNYELEAWNQEAIEFDINLAPDFNIIGWIEKICHDSGRKMPSKVRLAEYIVWRDSDRSILNNTKKSILKNTLVQINHKLK